MKRFIALLTIFLSACAGFSKIGPGPVSVGGKMNVALDASWNKFDGPGSGPAELWTREGLPLDTLVFYSGLKEGSVLGDVRPQQKEKEVPKFKSTMQPHDIVELYDAFITAHGSTFKLDKLAPDTFVGIPGFRFDFTLSRKGDEVVFRGVGFGAVRAGELYLMVYRAPRLHYFPKSLPEIEAIARSARASG